jgi:hypothetical protein
MDLVCRVEGKDYPSSHHCPILKNFPSFVLDYMAFEAEILPYLSKDPRLDNYTLEITYSSVWAEVTKPLKLPKGSFFVNITTTLCPDLPDTFTILDLSLATKRAILENKWYDPGNPYMIIWPEPYRMVFNCSPT